MGHHDIRTEQYIRKLLSANTGRLVLLALAEADELSSRELSERVGASVPTVTFALGRAELVRLVSRTIGRQSPDGYRRVQGGVDGMGTPRRNRWRITEEGKTFVESLDRDGDDT